jgi:hypothetical protein
VQEVEGKVQVVVVPYRSQSHVVQEQVVVEAHLSQIDDCQEQVVEEQQTVELVVE